MEVTIAEGRPSPTEGADGMTACDVHVYERAKSASEARVPLATRLDDEDPRVISSLVRLAGAGYLNITES